MLARRTGEIDGDRLQSSHAPRRPGRRQLDLYKRQSDGHFVSPPSTKTGIVSSLAALPPPGPPPPYTAALTISGALDAATSPSQSLSAGETITNGQRCGFFAGIASLAVSPVIIVLAAPYFIRRRRTQRRRQRRLITDATEPRESLHPYKVTVEATNEIQSETVDSRDPKHVLGTPAEKTVPQHEEARRSNASSLDDPEKLVALRRVMRQAGFTIDAMVTCLGRVARLSSYNGGLSPVNPPPMYER
ncbi:hypothetical protein AURDEDRAFT_116520 [Auricularia subglabra TFB-10046 SS5]|nr:hypothetical protein AURDEDRAFT_116520 [Auricularia subglabra TFB-10046 SS5]